MLCIWVKNQPYKQTRSAWWCKLYVLAEFELQICGQVCGLLVVPRDVSHSDRAVVVSPCVTDLCVVWVCAA